MKTIIIIISVLCISNLVLSQYGKQPGISLVSHDSLLYEAVNFVDISNKCKLKAMSVSGIAFATVCKFEISETCGEEDTVEVCTKRQIFPGDLLKPEEEIYTGANGYLTIMLSDGKTIRFGHNTKITINGNYCDNNFKTQVLLDEGELYINAKPNNDVKGINVLTEYGSAVTEGTEFSYEINKENEIIINILKVFEGSVKFSNNRDNIESKKKSEDTGSEVDNLSKDYQSGKLTLEEYLKKVKEWQNKNTDFLLQKSVIVNAGFESRIEGTDTPTESKAFNVEDNRWWEEK